jgi:cell division protein FtsB
MLQANGRVRDAIPAVNLVTLLVTVGLLWWRTASLEATVEGLRTAVVALQVEVAVLTAKADDRP